MVRVARLAAGLALVACAACSSETRSSERRREASYPGGRRIEVLKKDSFTHYKGLVTGHEYGTRHEYSYSFVLSPEGVSWSGGSAEPKQLILCPEQIYLRYLDIELEERDAGARERDASTVATERVMKAVARQARLRDERYFFRLLGDASWIDVEPSELPGAGCSAHAIPNDAELELGKPVSEP